MGVFFFFLFLFFFFFFFFFIFFFCGIFSYWFFFFFFIFILLFFPWHIHLFPTYIWVALLTFLWFPLLHCFIYFWLVWPLFFSWGQLVICYFTIVFLLGVCMNMIIMYRLLDFVCSFLVSLWFFFDKIVVSFVFFCFWGFHFISSRISV